MTSEIEKRQIQKTANRAIGAAIEAASIVEMLKNTPADQQTLVSDSVLAQHVYEIWQNHDSITSTLDETHCKGMTSRAVSGILLQTLRCKTPEEFLARFADAQNGSARFPSAALPFPSSDQTDLERGNRQPPLPKKRKRFGFTSMRCSGVVANRADPLMRAVL